MEEDELHFGGPAYVYFSGSHTFTINIINISEYHYGRHSKINEPANIFDQDASREQFYSHSSLTTNTEKTHKN